jgi:hypothetical protein
MAALTFRHLLLASVVVNHRVSGHPFQKTLFHSHAAMGTVASISAIQAIIGCFLSDL